MDGTRSRSKGICLAAALVLAACQTPPAPERAAEPEKPVTEVAVAERPPEAKPVEPVAPEKIAAPEAPAKVEPAPERLPIESQARAIGAEARRVGLEHWEIVKGERALSLTADSRVASLNGVRIILNDVFSEKADGLRLSELDYEYTLKPAMDPLDLKFRSRVVVLDPGHGGSEPGAQNESLGLIEKDLNLDVAVRVQKILEERGVKVVMTRYDDRLVSFEDRLRIAQRSKPALFASIHFNSAPNADASGLETFILTPAHALSSNDSSPTSDMRRLPGNEFDLASFEFGHQVQRALVSELQRKDRGLKRARFKVLTELPCPGVLVECGFLSNGQEALLVKTPVFRQKLASAMADAIDAALSD